MPINTPWTPSSSESTPWSLASPSSTPWGKENLQPAQGFLLLQDGVSHALLQDNSSKVKLE